MCNYGRDKLNTQQSKAFPGPWFPDVDKEQAAFLGQLTVFKIAVPVVMNVLTADFLIFVSVQRKPSADIL